MENIIFEKELIPYQISELPKGPYLIFAPHPDDETFGMGGTIALARKEGIEVHVTIVTNGDKQGNIEERKKEIISALQILGVNNYYFLNYRDRETYESYKNIFKDIKKYILKINPKTIFIPSFFEIHPDHRVISSLVYSFWKDKLKKTELWFYEISKLGEINSLIDITEVIEIKKKAIEKYESQFKFKNYKEFVLNLNKIRAFTLPENSIYSEGFYILSPENRYKLPQSLPYSYLKNLPFYKENPLVTIIVRTKNRPHFLERCIKSINNQTYRPIEIILINDGGEPLEIEKLKDKLNDIELNYIYNEKNYGKAYSADLGIKKAKGKYIGFLDDDDIYYPDHIDTLVNFLENSDYKIAYTNCKNVFINYDKNKNEFIKISENEIYKFYDFSYYNLIIGNFIPFNSLLFNSSVLKNFEINLNLTVCEDWDLLIKIAKKYPFYHINKTTCEYTHWSKDLQENKLLENIEKTIIKNNIDGVEISNLILEFRKVRDNLIYKINNLYEQIKDKDVEINKLDNIIKEKDINIIYLSNQINVKNNIIKEKDNKINNLNNQIQILNSEISYLKSTGAWKVYVRFQNFKNKYIPENSLRRKLYDKLRNFVINKFKKKISEYSFKEPILTKKKLYEIEKFKYKPMISIIMPVYNIHPKWLKLTIKSVKKQWYKNWELCIVDDGSKNKKTLKFLKKLKHPKIKIKFLEKNKGISEASNEALKMASGEYIALLDHDDEITPDALYEVVKAINKFNAEFIYSDEDKIDKNRNYCSPYFKPDFSPDLLLSCNYITHFICFKKQLLNKIGGFNSKYDGAQDYDLILRLTEVTNKIYHIPKILYHWRMIETSTSCNSNAKPKALLRKKQVLIETLKRRKIEGEVVNGNLNFYFKINYKIIEKPLISIIIFVENVEFLEMCIGNILSITSYSNFEIIILIDSILKDTDILDKIKKKDKRIRVIFYDDPNKARLFNEVVKCEAKGKHIVFLHNDIKIITPQWIEELLMHSQRQEVGCIGVKLYYPNNTIQHAGIIIGIKGYFGYAFKHFEKNSYGYFNRLNIVHNISAVTSACMMVKRELYLKMGGFDEKKFSNILYDIDFCLRVREKGYFNIFTPYVEAYHYEAHEFVETLEKQKVFFEEITHFKKRYKKILEEGDPYYNPNLTLEKEDFSFK